MNKTLKIFLPVLLTAALFGLITFLYIQPRPAVETVVIADGSQPAGTVLYVALEKGFFKKKNLDVVLQSFPFGKRALESLLDGQADYATAAETPFVHAALEDEDVRLVATLGKADSYYAVFASKASGIREPRDLRGKRIGVSFGTTGEYFVSQFLNLNGIKTSQAKMVNLDPDSMIEALESGQVDALATWGQIANKISDHFKDQIIVFDGHGITTFYWNLTAMRNKGEKQPAQVEKILQALKRAEEWCYGHAKECAAITERRLQISPNDFYKVWDEYDLKLSLNQSLLLSCENQARWFLARRFGPDTPPNFLEFIYSNALRKIDPEAITLIE